MRNRIKTATPNTRQFIDGKVDDVELPKEPEQVGQTESSNEPSTDQQGNDDNWLDELTPYETQTQEPQSQQVERPTTTSQPSQDISDDGTQEQKDRLAKLYAELEHVDEDVAHELHDKLIAPELQAVKAELNELRQYREREQQAKQTAVLADINAKIFEKYPKAEKILRSKQFMDFVNSHNNPYSNDTEFNILMKAYYAGDANYVLAKIDDFVSSRGKPKPPVGAEPQQGGGRSGVADTTKQKKVMSDAEYLAKRKAIKSAPKGTYPPNALRDLVNEYMNSRG